MTMKKRIIKIILALALLAPATITMAVGIGVLSGVLKMSEPVMTPEAILAFVAGWAGHVIFRALDD